MVFIAHNKSLRQIDDGGPLQRCSPLDWGVLRLWTRPCTLLFMALLHYTDEAANGGELEEIYTELYLSLTLNSGLFFVQNAHGLAEFDFNISILGHAKDM